MTEEKQTVDDLYADDDAVVSTPDIVGDNGGTPPADTTPPAKDDTPPKENEPVDDRLGIERYLAEYGIDGGMISFEDGTKVHINELSPEEQHVVLNSLATDNRPTIEQAHDLNEEEVGLLNMLRESGKGVSDVLADLANKQVDKIRLFEESQSVDWDNMGADAVYLAFLKDKNPELSDEDLQEDLEKAKETKTYDKVVEGVRIDFKNSQEYAREKKTAEATAKIDQDIDQDRHLIVDTISPMDNIAGFEIDDTSKNALLGDILELNEVGDSLLLEKIFESPENIIKHAWFHQYGEKAISDLENYWKQEASKAYARGRAEALGKLPETGMPATIGGKRVVQPSAKDNFNSSPNAQTVDDLYSDED